ncbi:tape measure protein [Pseudomonas chlororaphis]
MSSINEEIARLTGTLKFNVDAGPLHRFMSMLKTSEKAMRRIGREAELLSAKLNKAFGITGKGASAERLKLDAAVRKSLDKELQTEVRLSKLKRQQFVIQLAEKKLIATGKREEAFLQSAALKSQIQSAVLANKQQKALQESIKTDLSKAKLQASAEQSQLRQARLADILRKRQERTIQLQRQAASHATAMQRAEQALLAARERGARQAEKYQTSKVAAAIREARAATRADQTTARFTMATERHEAWKAHQARPEGLGLAGLSVGLTAASAALYGLVRGIGYLDQRVKQRQADASSTEQFNTVLEQSGGKNPANQKFARDQYVDISNKFGMELSVESAKAYSQFIQGQLALGKGLSVATKMFEDQSAVFRAAALDAEAQKRAAYQLNQIRSKGKPEGSDVNDLFDAVGGVVAASIRQAAATRLNFKGKVEEQAGWFKKAVTDGKILSKDFDQGMSNYLKANQDVLAKQMSSIAAAQQRAENQSFMNASEINSNQELKGVILERIQAERELNQAMQPFKESLASFDVGLTKLATVMLRFAAGKNDDGSAKTPEQRAQEVGSVGLTEGAAIDPNVMFPPKPSNGEKVGDQINRFYNWLTNSPSYEEGPANKVQAPQQNLLGTQFPKLDLSRFETKLSDIADRVGEYTRFRDDTLQPITSRELMLASGSSVQYPVQQITTTNEHVTNNNNEVRNEITVNVTAPVGADAPEIGRVVRDELGKVLRETGINQKETE